MSKSEVGKFTFDENLLQKTINLQESYANQIVVKLTTNKNVNIYLTDVQNNYFIVEKNTNEEIEVNYIVIESDS